MTTDDNPGRKSDDTAREPADDARRSGEKSGAKRPPAGCRSGSADRDAVDRLFESLPTVRVSRLPDDEHE
jgi:hypothetical protein